MTIAVAGMTIAVAGMTIAVAGMTIAVAGMTIAVAGMTIAVAGMTIAVAGMTIAVAGTAVMRLAKIQTGAKTGTIRQPLKPQSSLSAAQTRTCCPVPAHFLRQFRRPFSGQCA